MDAVIKSFNRAHYLDRCLSSLVRHATGIERVIVLDDGTPERFLRRIEQQYPDVEVRRSGRGGGDRPLTGRSPGSIPTAFWIAGVRATDGDQFLLLEEDMWLTSPVDFGTIAGCMAGHHMKIVKLTTYGSRQVFPGRHTSLARCPIVTAEPAFLRRGRRSRAMAYLVRGQFTDVVWRRRLLRLATRTHVVDRELDLAFYAVYSVAGAVFDRRYWLALWDEIQDHNDEMVQLQRAIGWALNDRASTYGRLSRDALATSFTSAATDRYPEADCSMDSFNLAMNEAWLRGAFDRHRDEVSDFPDELIVEILRDRDDPSSLPAAWLRWAERMRSQYEAIGCDVGRPAQDSSRS